MKKTLAVIIVFICFLHAVNAQNELTELKFDTKYFDAVDQYVAFPKKEKDSTFSIYFIYVDEMAGFSMRFEDQFSINKKGKLKLQPNPDKNTSALIARLNRNTAFVSVLTNEQKADLQLPKQPEWLKNYKPKDSIDVGYLTKIGYFYNHDGASHNAIEPLLKAYKKEPHYKGLEFELGFAYNATKQFSKAIPVLEKALKKDENNQLLYKELGYALVNNKQIDEAEKVYEKGISISKDIAIKCEMAVNMAQLLFKENDKIRFKKWAAIARKYGEKTPQYIKYIDYFEAELNKK